VAAFATGLVLLLCYPFPALAAAPENAVAAQIRAGVERLEAGSDLVIQGTAVASTTVLPALYRQRNFMPVWSNPGSVAQLFDALRNIHNDGLNARDYHLAALEDAQANISATASPDVAQLADFDILLTDSLIRLGYHLLTGKVDPVKLDSNWNMERRLDGMDAVLALSRAIEQGTVDNLLAALRPQHLTYRRLKQALAHYRAIAANGGWPLVPAGETLKPGMRDPRVVALRKRLAVTQEVREQDSESPVFDEGLEASVRTFQARNGLAADGIVGRATLEALNVPVEARIDQIRVNLERARWVLHDLPQEFVLVDIAGFNVRFIRNGRTVWDSRAVVGRPYRKTPVFKSSITYLEMNPTWTVPPTILRNDVLPAIKRDIGYLRQQNMRVIDYNHNVIDPASIDWQRYSGRDFPYLIRQDPGPHNALGRIKFMFPNEHLVYLHDTPSKSLFERTERAFSSGCIRIEHPFRLAELLLDDPDTWNQDTIRMAIDAAETRKISLPRAVTVILLYWTVATDGHGEVTFKQDLYDRDAAVLAGLNSDFSFHQPAFSWAGGAEGT
jgi:murein L,D-transpeptidase YcbB/YkuD